MTENIDHAYYWPDTFSLASFGEILFPCLEAAGVRSVVEVGAYEGEFTERLLNWAAVAGGPGGPVRIAAIDPEPKPELTELAAARPELELIEQTSHAALATTELADAVIIDGDHNYFTVSEELRIIGERAGDGPLPLLIFHDVAWPHARRDTYYVPERIPPEARQPIARNGAIAPGDPGLADVGLPYEYVAAREGGPRNGVLTAIEDFVATRDDVRLAVIPAFHGLGILWQPAAPWADDVAGILEPWDDAPLVHRLEINRIKHMTNAIRADQLEGVLRTMLGSRALAVAEWISRFNQRGKPMFSRERIIALLGDDDDDENDGRDEDRPPEGEAGA